MSPYRPERDENRHIRKGRIEVMVAAVAFAASVPASKLLLGDVSPLALSGTLYLSAGLLCGLLVLLSRRPSPGATGNAIRGGEWAWLAAAVVSGGVLAPLLLFVGLRQVSGHVAGLLLNFEAVFTVALGVLISSEHLGRRGWGGAIAVVLGSVLLALPEEQRAVVPTSLGGIGLVIGACALWGLDNNLTQRVSLRDARQIVAIKGLVGGMTSLALAAAFGGFGHWNAVRVLSAVGVGAISFGLSIALFVRGLRQLGVLQTGTLFALAPGFAAILSWIFLREPLGGWGIFALALMTAGALLLATDRHEHFHRHVELVHAHEVMAHTHEHRHDDGHHTHVHPGLPAGFRHTHAHEHGPLAHSHPHAPDLYHRHEH